jgi:hypothetical protein
MADVAATPETLARVFAAALSGDTIRLAAGEYPKGYLSRAFDTPITLQAADPASPPRFTGTLTLRNAANINLLGLDYDISAATASYAQAVRIYAGRNLAFIGGRFIGSDKLLGCGLAAADVVGLTVQKAKFGPLHTGSTIDRCSWVDVTDCDFSGLGSDGLTIGDSSDMLIARNLFDDFRPVAGAHPDAIQIQNDRAGPGSKRVMIRDNAVRGDVIRPQGIFVTRSNPGIQHEDIEVADNLLINTGYQGIMLSGVRGARVVGNRLMVNLTGAAGEARTSWIKLLDCLGDVSGNQAPQFDIESVATSRLATASPANTTTKLSGTGEIATALAAWKGKHRQAPPPEPPAPIGDELRAALAPRVDAKLEPLKTKGRLIINFKTAAQAKTALEAVLALPRS